MPAGGAVARERTHFSPANASGRRADQQPGGVCETVTVTRVIRWPDGRVKREPFATTYRPEGQSC